jgi:hypothetical protein
MSTKGISITACKVCHSQLCNWTCTVPAIHEYKRVWKIKKGFHKIDLKMRNRLALNFRSFLETLSVRCLNYSTDM